jgi:Fuc2NAc and GlcNAc transferase
LDHIQTISTLIPALCALVAWGVAALMVRHARRLNCVATPNHRSSHVRPTPSSGGLGIVAAGLLAGIALTTNPGLNGWSIMALSLLIASVGLRDDIRYLSIKARLLAQTVCISGLVLVLMQQLPPEIPHMISVPYALLIMALVVAGMWWLNLFNFMDGIDGMAATQTIFLLIAAASLGAWYHPEIIGTTSWVWMLAIAAATAGFMRLNWAPARIFMGDVGSLYLAFMTFAFMLWSMLEGWFTLDLWLILTAAFVSDTTVTLLTRMLRGERWYEAHCSHAYQRLARYWGSHASTTRLYLAINLFWLMPLAILVQSNFAGAAWWMVAIAYAPLVTGAVLVGAGRAGNISKITQATPSPMKAEEVQS